ncbi:BRCT domain-containing protein [Flintibacter muris]|uniref:BRCT domain-containing protein n=1 Tax=Flintibacter muris TaxID=2941327 RepID=UPI0020400B6D|nr:BRCT domain-containing protein [Flintibacter muris]
MDVTRFGLEHREFGRVWPDEDWNEFAGSYNIPYQVSGMVDIHGKEYQVNVDKIVGFPSDFEIVREDMDMGLTVSGGRVLLQLSPDEEWHCLSTEISEEDVENQGSIEEYFDSLWDFWLFGDGDCPWYELCPSDILLKILCAALPDRTLSVRECESVPHFLDTDGNEYFFGKMVSFDCEFSWEEDSNVHLTANEWKKLVFSVQDGAIYAEQVTELTVQGSAFVLSGTFVHYNDDRDKIKALIVAKGGRCTASVSGKTNYLVLGSQGSFGEKKVEQAQALQENGKDIKIITEETLFKFLK